MAKRLENYSKAVRYLRGNEILVVVGSNMDKCNPVLQTHQNNSMNLAILLPKSFPIKSQWSVLFDILTQAISQNFSNLLFMMISLA